MIAASTELCGVILHPAAHTRSPAMHNAAFAALGLDAAYLAFDVPPERLAAAIEGARALGIRQLAVSIPHKEAVMGLVDSVDETARAIGAANTVTRDRERLVATNTDWIGLTRAIERETTLAGKHAVVLGAGGTARAAVFALGRAGASCTVLNRTVDKAAALAAELGANESGSLADLADCAHDIVINTTSVGLRSDTSPVAAAALRRGTVVFDAVYDPAETRLLRDAVGAGARPVGGKWMLVYQAVEQVVAWSGRRPDPECMADAFDAAG